VAGVAVGVGIVVVVVAVGIGIGIVSVGVGVAIGIVSVGVGDARTAVGLEDIVTAGLEDIAVGGLEDVCGPMAVLRAIAGTIVCPDDIAGLMEGGSLSPPGWSKGGNVVTMRGVAEATAGGLAGPVGRDGGSIKLTAARGALLRASVNVGGGATPGMDAGCTMEIAAVCSDWIGEV
jgi:hypothetical protein